MERDIQDRIELMCRGCIFNETGTCSNIMVGTKGQREFAKHGACNQTLIPAIDQGMFPLIEISLISAIRYRTATGGWDTQIDPMCS